MTVVINGSGTITGISTGGLPDGIVDDGTLATSAVTSTKIADGTILNADINASAAIAGSKVDGSFGKVLQVVASHDPNKSSTTSMTAVALSTTPTGITPTSTSNKVLVQISGSISNEGVGNGNFKLYRIISGGATTEIDGLLSSLIHTHTYNRDMIGVTFLDSPNTTSSVTYAIYGLRIDGVGEPSTGGRGNDNNYKTGIRWTLSEVGN